MDDFKEKFLSPFLPSSFEWSEEEKKHENVSVSGDAFTDLPLFDEQDKEILMHRDVHFSGSFGAMLEYYSQEDAKGIYEEIDLERIQFLERIQHLFNKDLAPILLSGGDAEKVAKMKKLYAELQKVAEEKATSAEGILAEAILSEEDIDEIVQKVPQALLEKPELLLPLVSSEEFSDVLAPGYGLAPLLAIELLGKARYQGAIKDLFLCIGKSEENIELASLSALKSIGEEAKRFGMKILRSRPITLDTERAVLMLTQFLPDEEVRALFLEQLQDQNIKGILREYVSGAIQEE